MSESEPTPTPAELPESPLDPLAALLERQKAEIRELTKTTQKIKHAVPKGDKRRQKDAAQEIANLESALYDRHTKETKELKAQLKAGEVTEDESKRLQEQLQKTTDRFIKEIDALVASKEAEIMEV